MSVARRLLRRGLLHGLLLSLLPALRHDKCQRVAAAACIGAWETALLACQARARAAGTEQCGLHCTELRWLATSLGRPRGR